MSEAVIVIEIGLIATSAVDVDDKVKRSTARLRKEWLVGEMEYYRGPQKVTPSELPLDKLTESMAITVSESKIFQILS